MCRALLDGGVRPWFDKWDLSPGNNWLAVIEEILTTIPPISVCVAY